MGTDEFKGQWGTYLSGMYQTAMMTISTSVQAVAECSYDRTEEALGYVKQIASTFNRRLPGSISEMSPDYGCFVQAWTAYGMVWPLITHMFGIQPKAHWKEIILRPRMPKEWAHAEVENVCIGIGENNNTMNVSFERNLDEEIYRFSFEKQGWRVLLDLDYNEDKEVLLDGKPTSPNYLIESKLVVEIISTGDHEIKIINKC
jgi:hypothetical protein